MRLNINTMMLGAKALLEFLHGIVLLVFDLDINKKIKKMRKQM